MNILVKTNFAKVTEHDPDYLVVQKQRNEDDTGYVMVQIGDGWKYELPNNTDTPEDAILLKLEITKSTYSRK